MVQGTESGDVLRVVREYVHKVLCSRDNLRSDCFQLSQRALHRGEQLCGWHFCLHGPRQLQLSAIWDVQSQQVWFYGARGERFLTAAAPLAA